MHHVGRRATPAFVRGSSHAPFTQDDSMRSAREWVGVWIFIASAGSAAMSLPTGGVWSANMRPRTRRAFAIYNTPPGSVRARLGRRNRRAKLRHLIMKPSLREAAISIVSPVPGLRPWRAALSLTLNLPKLGRLTSSPFLAASTIPAKTASTAFLAVLTFTPAAVAT
jgi:hypothetical protein